MASAGPDPTGGSAPVHSGDVRLRDVAEGDIHTFFGQQLDPEANRMAAFTAGDPADRTAFETRWERLLGDPSVTKKAILLDGSITGHVVSFDNGGAREVTYWLGREYWGGGITTRALSAFLRVEETRPLYARAAKDNTSSIRVLQKCGFVISGEDRAFAYARGTEVEEFVLELGPEGPRGGEGA